MVRSQLCLKGWVLWGKVLHLPAFVSSSIKQWQCTLSSFGWYRVSLAQISTCTERV